MEIQETNCVNKIIRYVPFSETGNSFLRATLHQIRRLHLCAAVCALPELQAGIEEHLVKNEIYEKLPVRHDTQILRCLVRYFKVCIEMHFTSGFQQTFPFAYRLGEPTIRLLSLPSGYGSITNVCKMN